MATYKAVDTEQLNAGLKDIANAIRTKAGTSGALAFPSAMAEAIGNIPAGSKVASGSFTPAQDASYGGQTSKTLRSSPITISGLGFMPTRVIVFNVRAGNSLHGTDSGQFLLAFDSSMKEAILAFTDDTDWDGYYDYVVVDYAYSAATDITGSYASTPYRMTFNADGFTLGKSNYRLPCVPNYWIALG